MQSEAKKIAVAVIAALLTGLLGFVVSPFARDLWSFGADTFLPKLSKQGQLSLVATFAILCLVLASLLYCSNSKRMMQRRYQHLLKRGFWVHRKTGQRVCGNCLIAGIESPLSCFSVIYPNGTFQRYGWFCGRKDCNTEYHYETGDVPGDK